MMAGNPNWWSLIPPSEQPSTLLSPSNFFPPQHGVESSRHDPRDSSLVDHHSNHDELPQSWSQLLFGGLSSGDEERFGMNHDFQPKKLESWEHHQILNPSQIMPVSSPKSCVTNLSSTNDMLDFSNNKANGTNNSSSECNSTASGGVSKKARVQTSTNQPHLKVRKEKLGDRITALHQLVSPFGKTDTASVLLEATGYIRFLQGQIQALSSPYLGTASINIRNQQSIQGGQNLAFSGEEGSLDKPKDLRSRGLCLVPISCPQQVGSENGADYWTHAPAFEGGF